MAPDPNGPQPGAHQPRERHQGNNPWLPIIAFLLALIAIGWFTWALGSWGCPRCNAPEAVVTPAPAASAASAPAPKPKPVAKNPAPKPAGAPASAPPVVAAPAATPAPAAAPAPSAVVVSTEPAAAGVCRTGAQINIWEPKAIGIAGVGEAIKNGADTGDWRDPGQTSRRFGAKFRDANAKGNLGRISTPTKVEVLIRRAQTGLTVKVYEGVTSTGLLWVDTKSLMPIADSDRIEFRVNTRVATPPDGILYVAGSELYRCTSHGHMIAAATQ